MTVSGPVMSICPLSKTDISARRRRIPLRPLDNNHLLPFLDRPKEVHQLLHEPLNTRCLDVLQTTLGGQSHKQFRKVKNDLMFRPRPQGTPNDRHPDAMHDAEWLSALQQEISPESPHCWSILKHTLGASSYSDEDIQELCLTKADYQQTISNGVPLPTYHQKRSLDQSRILSAVEDSEHGEEDRGNSKVMTLGDFEPPWPFRNSPDTYTNALGLAFPPCNSGRASGISLHMASIPEDIEATFSTEERRTQLEADRVHLAFNSFSEPSGISRYMQHGMLTPPPEYLQLTTGAYT